jgi:peroxiredoxin
MTDVWIGLIIAALVAGAAFLMYRKRPSRPVPDALKPGRPLPDFTALDEHGEVVHSTKLKGAPAVMIFVRGNWCPFCSRQVKDLTAYYKDMADLGAKLVFVTPKPQETTRRVAEFFEVKFDFWLDESLAVTRQLGLLLEGAVPESHAQEYGADTIWPTSLVIDAEGIIRFVDISKLIMDRPNPKTLLRELQKAIEG